MMKKVIILAVIVFLFSPALQGPNCKKEKLLMKDYKRKLAAIFSADVAGYSRLMREEEA